MEYAVCLALLLAVVALYELGGIEMGGLLENERLAFWMENIGIILMIALLPYALKKFSAVVSKINKEMPCEKRLDIYLRMSRLRLGILWLVCCYNIVLYYETLNSIGAFCALAAFLSMFFCVPGKRKVGDELHMNADEVA